MKTDSIIRKPKPDPVVQEVVQPIEEQIPEQELVSEVIRWEYVNWLMVIYTENSLINKQE